MTEDKTETPEGLIGAETPPPPRHHIFRRLYNWTLHWAKTPHAQVALFLLAFAEACFFPVPPDVLLIAMAMAAPKRSLRFGLICMVGSVTGGVACYHVGMLAFETVGRPLIEFYEAEEVFAKLLTNFGKHGFSYVFIAALSPIPYCVFMMAAGVCHETVSLQVVVLASVLGRGLRFFAIATLFRLFGKPIKKFIDKYFNLLTIAFVILLVGGFLVFKLAWKGDHKPQGVPDTPAPIPQEPAP